MDNKKESIPIIPSEFKARYHKLLGKENKTFLRYCMKPLKKSIRLNPIKTDIKEIKKRLEEKYGWKLKKIPWYKYGFWIENEDVKEGVVGNTLEHFMGYYYVQEAASMIPPVVLDPNEDDLVLDMCAAPGSKTTQICEMINNKGTIIANDVDIPRIKALRFNIEKLGCANVVVTRMDGREFSKTKLKFDKVLVDAPCSAEGTIRKDWKALSRWSINLIKSISGLQKKLILAAYDSLKEGGTLVYSTCTLSPEENEGVINYLIENREGVKIKKIDIPGIKYHKGVVEWEKEKYCSDVKKIARIYPHDNDTEGFVIAKIVKET